MKKYLVTFKKCGIDVAAINVYATAKHEAEILATQMVYTIINFYSISSVVEVG